ncbi:saccharopine dehydrogenase [Cellulomonas sp. PS-H5]|uniref:saccharopine dehydrogenase n=1 Tax=Cellulomonas sp. PS-H5 TaxID=2820400 RepID=UPI001C4F1491|nr:saccharopine dehydrogenase [Cellulomonas sp. PS-H5]MBW0256221.1 saccharopine dehydrogenase [Cellulomonas sp. PS-H5]
MPDSPTPDRPLHVLVLGGYGAVGARANADLRAAGHAPRTAGRDARRADVALDLADRTAVTRAAREADVVLNAAGREDVDLVRAVTDAGTPFVDISATTGYLAALERLEPAAPVLVSVGIAPGLTNLLAHAVVERDAAAGRAPSGPLDVGVVLGAGEAHGAAATAWSLLLLGRSFPDTTRPGATVRNYTRGARFDLPGGPRRLLRADFSDQHALTRELGRPVRTFFGTDTRFATAALAALTWAPPLGRLAGRLHLPGTEDWLLHVRDASGPRVSVTGSGQSAATAAVAAQATVVAAGAPAGVHHLPALVGWTDLRLPITVTWHSEPTRAPRGE